MEAIPSCRMQHWGGHYFSRCPAASTSPLHTCCKPTHQDTKLVQSGKHFCLVPPCSRFWFFSSFPSFLIPYSFSLETSSSSNGASFWLRKGRWEKCSPAGHLGGKGKPLILALALVWISSCLSEHHGGRHIPALSNTFVMGTNHIPFKTGCAQCPLSPCQVTAQNSFCVFSAARAQSFSDHLPWMILLPTSNFLSRTSDF